MVGVPPQLSASLVIPVNTSGTDTAQLVLPLVLTVRAEGQVNVGLMVSPTTTERVEVQPLLPVTVTEYVPEVETVVVLVVLPVDHAYVR